MTTFFNLNFLESDRIGRLIELEEEDGDGMQNDEW
jgi:hypothetical protein